MAKLPEDQIALLNQSSIAIVGNLPAYSSQEDISSPDNYSDLYYFDRATMLKSLLARNLSNHSQAPIEFTSEPIYFDDRVTGEGFITGQINLPGGGQAYQENDVDWITFDDNESNGNLLGGDNNDRIYGSGGNDIINGQRGNDYLEGGQGNDTFRIDFNSNGGMSENDIIFDNMGSNTLEIQHEASGGYDSLRGKDLTLLAENGASFYAELDDEGDPINDTRYRFSGQNLVITTSGSANNITIKNFLAEEEADKNNNTFGIDFNDSNPAEPPLTDFVADYVYTSFSAIDFPGGVNVNSFYRAYSNDRYDPPQFRDRCRGRLA